MIAILSPGFSVSSGLSAAWTMACDEKSAEIKTRARSGKWYIGMAFQREWGMNEA
jgi:hypothetical protein